MRLRLKQGAAIKYNAVINKVGKVATREISHTNTFTLPHVHHNLQALGLNVFNPTELAKAMNAKYIAKYYVEDKLLKKGYLVINNTNGGLIKVNFIAESLSLTSQWGSISYQELLQDEVRQFPADYAAAIAELRDYDLDKNAVLTPLSEIGTRGYNLCLFPNNLNAIGDKFQIDQNEQRVTDTFNPYQSRPIWNAKSVFDLACEGFGYTADFDDSVDWDKVAETYIVNDKGDQSKKGLNGIQTSTYQTISSNSPYYSRFDALFNNFQTKALFNFSTVTSLRPNDIPGWVDPTGLAVHNPFNSNITGPWMSEQSVFTPNNAAGNVGEIHFIADHGQTALTNYEYSIFNIWSNATPGGDIVVDTVLFDSFGVNNPPTEFVVGTTYQVDLTIDKTYYDTIPTGADSLIGIMVSFGTSFSGSNGGLYNMIVQEEWLPEGVVAFDDFGQFLPDSADLAYAAPRDSVKKVLSNLMHKEGILMDINDDTKVVKFFNYGEYEQQRVDGNFSDWSKYLLKYDSFMHNTDYGTNYAKLNKIGLSDPFIGNTFDLVLENQGSDSKYKDVANDFVSAFKDVENVRQINNTFPYFEYTNQGVGLVEFTGIVTNTLTQTRADNTTQGTFNELAHVANVNYATIPDGVNLWYTLVDQAVRVDAKFLIPVDVMNSLDLSEPIYVEELGGFYIIEEIKEYINGTNAVTVKLIKLIDDYRGLEEQATTFPPQINLTATDWNADGFIFFNNGISTNTSFNFYNTPPTAAEIEFREMTNSIANGGTLTGDVITQTVNLSGSLSNINNYITDTTEDEAWYEIQVTDTGNNILSNKVYAYLGNTAPPLPPTVTALISIMSPGYGVPSGSAPVFYTYANHVNLTTALFTYRKYDYNTQQPIAPERSMAFPITPTFGTVQVAFTDGPGFYKINITTNEATSPPAALGGYFVI